MTDLGDPTWPIAAARAADDKQATDPIVLAVGDVLAVTDHFVIASAPNPRLVKAIVEEIESQLKAADGPQPIRAEGLDDLEWVLVDYGDVIVHVFLSEIRDFYEIERLYSDVPKVEWADVSTPATSD